MAAAAAVLPPRAAAVAMKTPAVTAMARAQTTINNQQRAVTTMDMMTMTAKMMTMETKGTAAAAAEAPSIVQLYKQIRQGSLTTQQYCYPLHD
jgi:hypothetical protein